MHIKLRLTIQTKIILSFALITVGIFLCVGIIFFTSVRSAVIEAKQKEMLTLSTETGNKIERFLFERHGDISVMAQSPILKDPAITERYRLEYLDSVRLNYQTYDSVMITDAAGKIITTSGERQSLPDSKQWLQSLRNGNIYVSDLVYFTNRKSYGMFFAAPLKMQSANNGTVIELMDFHAIFDIINNVKLGRKGYAFLMDQNGNIISQTTPGIKSDSYVTPLKQGVLPYGNVPSLTKYKKTDKCKWLLSIR